MEVLEVTNKEVKDNKEKYSYNNQRDFDIPLYLEGVGKVLRPNEDMENVPGEGILSEVMEEAKSFDNRLDFKVITLKDLKILRIENLELWEFEFSGDKYVIDSNIMMQKFSTFIGVPWQFTKKNPSYLTVNNFEYHIGLTNEKLKKDLVVIYEEVDGARKIYTFFSDNSKVVLDKESIMPLFGNIIKNLNSKVREIAGVDLGIQSYKFGYNGENNGNHFMRLLLNDDKYKMMIGGEEYRMGLNVLSPFIGTKYRGSTSVSVVLFRQVCSNGMVVEWDGQTKNELATIYAENIYGKLQVDKKVPVKDGKLKVQVLESLRKKFFKMVNNGGINIQTEKLNKGKIDESILGDILSMFINSKDKLASSVETLNEDFLERVEEKDMDFFINSCHRAARDSGISSPGLVKLFLYEFIASKLKGQNSTFKCGMDVVNFMTYVGKSYNAVDQFNIEGKAFQFGQKLRQVFLQGRVLSDYEKMKFQILSN